MKLFVIAALCFVAVSAGSDEDLWLRFNRRMPGGHHLTSPKSDESISGRVVGGVDAEIANFPYQLSLRYNGNHICGASVISGRWALSAAHCNYPPPDPAIMSLRGGSSNRLQGGEIFEIEEIVNHPEYDDWNLVNDVSVLRTTEDMLDSHHPHIHPIALDHAGSTHVPGSRSVLSGWGLNEQNVLPIILQRVDIPKVDFEYCIRSWPLGWVTPDMICASEPGRTACNGDSGGPLVVGGRQIGIVSWGASDCRGLYPTVFARVGYAMTRDFIRETTGV
ncbi:trypsin-1-like [Uranotaenia lowii]|uniref:trypsin-1-like n=1 Tax=Uranotaenia lowii TaxID=190385 RepID=UPI0024796B38|nr:trypsin-1-like [Uranotaenia lowii]